VKLRHDCGHVCCDQRRNRYHSHTVPVAGCTGCGAVFARAVEAGRPAPDRKLARLARRWAR